MTEDQRIGVWILTACAIVFAVTGLFAWLFVPA